MTWKILRLRIPWEFGHDIVGYEQMTKQRMVRWHTLCSVSVLLKPGHVPALGEIFTRPCAFKLMIRERAWYNLTRKTANKLRQAIAKAC